MTNRFRAKLLVSTMFVGVAAIAAPAMAQTVTSTEAQTTPPPSGAATDAKITAPSAADNSAPTTTNDIVVTGTLIRNPNLVSSSSVTSISEGELTLRAPNTVEEALRGLPGISPGIGTQVNNGQTGISFVDLRGLGPQRSLTLLDGNRIVPSVSSGLTDLNVMPLALLQRVEVLTAGAATTYGADAVSGVVNFITRRDFTGIDVRGDYKLPDRGDGKSYRTDVTVGANFADDRGNAVLSLGYTKIDPLYQTRPFALFGISSTSGKASGASATSVPTAIAFNNGDFLQVDPTSTSLVPQYQGFNFNPYNIFQTPLDQKRAYAAARYDVADGVEVYARGMFSNNTIQSIIAPSGIFGLGENINANNPYLTPAIRNTLCAEDGITAANCGGNTLLALPGVYRRLVELGPRVGTYENNLYDARAGVKVDITKSINLDVSGSYGRSEQTTTSSGYVINSLVQQALLATNTTTCTVTTGNCVPLNLFGAAGSITPAQVAFIQGQSTVRVNTELSQARALLSGDLGTTVPFASNPISFALGAEYRNYTYARIPDAYAQSPSQLGGAGGAVLPFTGSYSVKEGYGELIVPIANGQHFFDELSAQGGVRYSSYSIPGSAGFDTTTYKGGLTWQPVHGLRFRGSYQRAVRAPNIGELFAPKVTGLTNLTVDPCALAAPVGNANLTAVCIAQGANAAQIGVIPNPSAGQANETSGGNVNLKPEVGDTFTAGIVITPSQFVPGLTLTIDYNHILIRNAISTPTPGDAIAACFANLTAASATSPACTGIVRNPVTGGLSGPSGTVLGLPLSLSNTGRLETDGVDVTANYTHRFGEFRVDLNFLGNYTDKLKFQATPTSFNRDCVGYYSANCGTGVGQIVPKFTFQQRSTLTLGSASLSVLWRYINPVNYEGTASDYVARGFTTANHLLFNGVVTNSGGVSSGIAGNTYNFNHIPAYHYFDLSSQFNIAPHYQLTMTVANVFDRDPPIVGGQAGTTTANSGNTFPSTYDVLGRTFTVGVRLKF